MPKSPPSIDALPLYDVQLRDAYMLDATVSRRPKEESDTDSPALDGSVRAVAIADDRKALDVGVGVNIHFPFNEGQYTLEVDCTINGRFEASDAKPSGYWEAFAYKEAIALIWPYLRSTAGELGRLTGLSVPILPTVDVMGLIGALAGLETEPKKKRSARKAVTG